jgi:hypothetical protein
VHKGPTSDQDDYRGRCQFGVAVAVPTMKNADRPHVQSVMRLTMRFDFMYCFLMALALHERI